MKSTGLDDENKKCCGIQLLIFREQKDMHLHCDSYGYFAFSNISQHAGGLHFG